MAMCVCGGAVISCSFGAVPGVLMVTPENKVSAAMPLATISDQVVMINITTFDMCSSLANPQVAAATAAAFGVLTPMPCLPVIPAPWTPGSVKVKIGGISALTDTSTVQCAYGGIIQISQAGTTTHQCT